MQDEPAEKGLKYYVSEAWESVKEFFSEPLFYSAKCRAYQDGLRKLEEKKDETR